MPSPEQVGQTTAVSTVSSRVAPKAHSDRSSSILIVALRPRRARDRGPRAACPVAPKTASTNSLNGKPAVPNPPNPPAPAPAGGERVAAHVVHLALVGVLEDLVGLVDLLELLLRLRVRVDVRVQFAGQPAVGALDLILRGVAPHAEQRVIVLSHYDSPRIWPTYLATARTAPIVPG